MLKAGISDKEFSMKGERKDFEVDISLEGKEKSVTLPAEEHEGEESGAKGKRVTVKELREELKAKEEEIKSLNDRLLRTLAEFENYKKRITKEKSDLLKYANDEMSREILQSIDNLEVAVKHARETNKVESIIEGIEITLRQLLKSLERFGVSSFNSLGEKFDPNKHEAIVQVESSDHEPNTVIGETQKGYFLRDRLLRPALVTVAKIPPAESEE